MTTHSTNSQEPGLVGEEESIKEVISIKDDSPLMNDLKSALEANDISAARGFASTYIIKNVKVEKGIGLTSCSENQLKALLIMSDKERVKKETKVDEILTTSKTSVRIADKDDGPVKKRVPSSPSKTTSPKGVYKLSKDTEQPATEESRKLKEADETKKKDQDKHHENSKDREQKINDSRRNGSQLDDEIKMKNKEIERIKKIAEDLENKLARKSCEHEDIQKENTEYAKQINDCKNKLENANKEHNETKRKFEELHQTYESDVRTKNKQLKDISVERDEIRNRFMKLAGAKLTEQNADIADLKDPNRALKLSEKFAKLYNDEWTDAFAALKKNKLSKKEAIGLLLQVLQECLKFCNSLKKTQMDILKNVLLHPAQNVSQFVPEPRKHVAGLKDKPKFSAEDEKATLTLRRQIAVRDSILEEIKQVICIEIKSWDERGYKKKYLDLCVPYIQKCTEICWLMVLHDPPLHIKFDAKSGHHLDSTYYTIYASPGDKIDFVVWPPLLNEEGGGLLNKGVAQPLTAPEK